MASVVVDAMLPGRRYRMVPVVHPYTVGGRQIDVADGDEWVEIGECGVAAPAVLAGAGLDTDRVTGLAMGLGLDRILMLRKGIPDIRLLRSADPRVAEQMQDLDVYRPVSDQPAIERDVSIAVDADETAETLGDQIRAALGADSRMVEAVTVLAETAPAALPAAAVERLGIQPGQKNVLLHVVLRDLDRTLTASEANRLRDRIYAAVHRGAEPPAPAPMLSRQSAE
jgi:phenylalanyl-tRNA synthetase alpha chain